MDLGDRRDTNSPDTFIKRPNRSKILAVKSMAPCQQHSALRLIHDRRSVPVEWASAWLTKSLGAEAWGIFLMQSEMASTTFGDLFALARRELDRRDASRSEALRYRHNSVASFFLNEGWRRLHGGDALGPICH